VTEGVTDRGIAAAQPVRKSRNTGKMVFIAKSFTMNPSIARRDYGILTGNGRKD